MFDRLYEHEIAHLLSIYSKQYRSAKAQLKATENTLDYVIDEPRILPWAQRIFAPISNRLSPVKALDKGLLEKLIDNAQRRKDITRDVLEGLLAHQPGIHEFVNLVVPYQDHGAGEPQLRLKYGVRFDDENFIINKEMSGLVVAYSDLAPGVETKFDVPDRLLVPNGFFVRIPILNQAGAVEKVYSIPKEVTENGIILAKDVIANAYQEIHPQFFKY